MHQNEFLDRLHQQEGPLRVYLQFCGVPLQEIDEVLQDVLLTAWRRRETLQNPESLESWLRTIARRKASGHLRKMKNYWKRNWPFSSYEEAREEAGLPVPDELVYREMESFAETELYDLVLELGKPAASILMLHYVFQEPFVEIARILHMPVGTVRSIASRSREKLKKKILERRAADEDGKR
ncbi:MAG: RNA polymerase sigma factor [Firmicutes bacterium]|nr:RNA polymerase sigma factor [Bacillota bacterium]